MLKLDPGTAAVVFDQSKRGRGSATARTSSSPTDTTALEIYCHYSLCITHNLRENSRWIHTHTRLRRSLFQFEALHTKLEIHTVNFK